MDYDYAELLVENKLVSAITDLLRDTVVNSDEKDYKYIDLLGTSTFKDLDEFKYETLKPTILKEIQKNDSHRLVKLFFMFLLCILFIFYGIYEFFNGSFIIGVLTLLLFGIGGAFYFCIELKK